MKVAIVHDWLLGGGAEKVVLELHKMYPDAPIYTSYCTEEWRQKLDGKVVTAWLRHWPFSRLRKYIPFLRIWWFTHLKFEGYDLVISSSGAEAKGIKVSKPTLHINYCHAPTHYYWARYDEYMQHPGFGIFDPLARLGLKLLVGSLRRWDHKAAQRPDFIIANSTFTKNQIKKYYGRKAVVVHPPVDVERFKPLGNISRQGFVITGRQTPYKRVDLAVAACTKLNLSLKVIGRGPDHKHLVAISGQSVNFVTDASDREVAESLASAQAFIFPGIDDFGISAVEALATGTPVIAYKAGGALDYVAPAKTGEFFDPQTSDALASALQNFKPENYNPKDITQSAQQFNASTFRQKISEIIKEHL